MPLFIQGAIHGNEYEGVDSNMRLIERLATTPYGTDPEVDEILDGAVVVFNVIQNPDGRVAGTRANGNGFDLNRDFLTQSQSETKASVSIMQEWLPPETLDLHGYVTPTLVEATTKPHNPGIDYDLWLKWNQSRIDANEAAMAAVNLGITRPINDWCSDGSVPPLHGAALPGRPAGRPGGRRGLGRLGPVLHADVLAARRPERLDGRDVHEHVDLANPRQPLLPERQRRPDEEPDRPERGAARAAWSSAGRRSLYDIANRNELLHDQFEIYRRGVAGEARPACCPAPFDVENNWMHEFPTAYVIPVGAGQRSNAEANRLVEWLIFNGIQVTQAPQRRRRRGAERRARLVRRADEPGAPRPGGDVARHRRRHLEPDRHPLRAARGVEPRLPLGRRRDPGPERGGVHGPDDGPDREADEVRRRRRVR